MKTNAVVGMASAILMLWVGIAWAGSPGRIGTGGAPELRLPVGARSTALMGADIGSVQGAEALYYNPAGIAATDNRTEVMFSHTAYIADMEVNFVGVTQSLSDFGTIGISAKVLSIGEMVRTTEAAPDGFGDTFSPTYSVLAFGYGKRMTDRVNFGGTVSYVAEKILQESAAGMAFDFGFQYETGYHGMNLGMTMKNFGPNLQYNGSDFDLSAQLPGTDPQSDPRTVGTGAAQFELPSYFQLGLSYPAARGNTPLTLYGLFQSNSFGRDEGRLGAELGIRKVLALRAGYRFNGNDQELFNWSYGIGLVVPMGGSKLSVEYAGEPVKTGVFDDVQHIAVSLYF
ncbi:MAG: PorV/PorQ family protein [Candidatus Eisenbacteria bacterium]|nr:PorV/PorQ family protein [Candidatus Eisenbacteria bacterium]